MYLTQGLHRNLQQRGDEIGSCFGDRTRTWREIGDRVARTAGALRELGVGDGDRVAFLGMNSDWFHEFYLAVPWANAVVNPINTRWAVKEIAFSLRDSDSRVLIVDDTFISLVPELRSEFDGLDTVIHATDGTAADGALSLEDLIAQADPIEDARRSDSELAGLFYTGGTTGFPKGVMLSHTNLVTCGIGAAASRFIGHGARFLHTAPMFHLADFAAWLVTMATGGTHIMVPKFDVAAVCEAIEKYRVTDTVMVPAMLRTLVDSGELEKYEVSSLRNIGYGGSAITTAVLERTGKALPGVTYSQAFGQTELSAILTLLTQEDHIDGRRLTSAGRAVPYAELRIVDENDNDVPRGQVGEIAALGSNVMLGYWKRPEETAEALRNGWLHTGDAGYLDEDGYLHVVDRIKDMIVSGGENVYSAEVENAISQHPAVAACAVIAVPDEKLGERVHAVIVRRDGVSCTADDILAHTKTLIAGYKAPRSVEFLAVLPVSNTGKILKRELREPHWNRASRSVN